MAVAESKTVVPDTESVRRERPWNLFLILGMALAGATLMVTALSLLAGDWNFWTDWKDNVYWPLRTAVSTIWVLAAFQYIVWKVWRIPVATLVAVAFTVVWLVTQPLGFQGLTAYPWNFTWSATVIPLAILLDVVLMLARGSFIVTTVIGGFSYGALFYLAQYYMIAPFLQPVVKEGSFLTLANLQGFTYHRSATPEYLREVSVGGLHTFAGQVAIISWLFIGSVCMVAYAIGVGIGHLVGIWTIDRFVGGKRTGAAAATKRAAAQAGVIAAVGSLVWLSGAPPAHAHGENTQPSWARSTTVTFFDLNYSGDIKGTSGEGQDRGYTLDVGDVLKLSGKLQISDKWPVPVGDFELGQIGVLMQGPVLAIRDLKVNGVYQSGATVMRPGDFLTFDADLVARRPGLFHIHPRVDLQGKGPIIGPGVWVRINDTQPFTEPVTLASGEQINIEKYGLWTVAGYQLMWVVVGAVFCIGWLSGKRLLSRMVDVRRGVDNRELFTSRDRIVTIVAGVVTLGLIIGSFAYASFHYSTIPIQVREEAVPKMQPPSLVDARAQEIRFDPRAHSLRITAQVRNTTSSPIQVERLVIGPDSLATDAFYKQGDDQAVLTVEPATDIGPGESRTVTFTAPTGQLEADHVIGSTNSALVQLGGLLIVRNAQGERGWVTVVGDMIKT
jgi:methane monooxygenase/ammonia monooxygenase subunit A